MEISTVVEIIKKKQLVPLIRLYGLFTPFYRLGYIAALVDNGYFHLLEKKPLSLHEIMSTTGIEPEQSASLEAWLQVGVRLHEISVKSGKYGLAGISKQLAKLSDNDAYLAITQEVAILHHNLILKTPAQLKNGKQWSMSDQDGEMIARSSRILEPLQNEVIHTLYPKPGPVRLLEVGCGSGIYIKQAALSNPQLTAVGLELQAPVAAMARQNMETWGLQARVTIEVGDVREKNFAKHFDLVTSYNNIYYFPVAERVDLLKHLRSFLKPGGSLFLTTGCQGGSLAMELLNLWGATTQGCDRLPDADEMVAQMESAGFVHVTKKSLLPGDAFYVFIGSQSA